MKLFLSFLLHNTICNVGIDMGLTRLLFSRTGDSTHYNWVFSISRFFKGAMTLGITTLSITTFSVMALSITVKKTGH
jgi:hypothetical protein